MQFVHGLSNSVLGLGWHQAWQSFFFWFFISFLSWPFLSLVLGLYQPLFASTTAQRLIWCLSLGSAQTKLICSKWIPFYFSCRLTEPARDVRFSEMQNMNIITFREQLRSCTARLRTWSTLSCSWSAVCCPPPRSPSTLSRPSSPSTPCPTGSFKYKMYVK